MKKIKIHLSIIRFIIGLILVLAVVIISPQVFAVDHQKVVINELMWMGSSVSSADEWIELKNTTNQDIDISGWKLTRINKENEELMLEISSGQIDAGGYFLISNYDMGKQKSILNIKPDLVDTSVSLSNDHLQIKLYDQNENLIDTAGDRSKPLAGRNKNNKDNSEKSIKYSMERNDLIADGKLSSSWHTATQQFNFDKNRKEKGTPKSSNSPPIFMPSGAYSESVSKYITFVDCMEAEAKVTYIVDGDTIDVSINEEIYRVRLLGMNSPESAKYSEFNVDEPYYQESKEYAKQKLLGQTIKLLVSSDSKEQYDKYDRLLGAIIINNEIFNINSISQGLSRAYYLSNSIIISSEWQNEEIISKNNRNGIWEYFGLKSQIVINEFMPNPEGKDSENEWIELYNISDHEIDISNWFLDDGRKGSNPYLFPNGTIISPNGYLVIKITDSGIALNNKGDSVRLFNPGLSIVDEVVYTDTAKDGWSYNRADDGSWFWSYNSTSGFRNAELSESEQTWSKEPEKVENISQARKISNSKYVQVKGFVTVKPGILSTQYFYIQDDTAAIQIYSYYKQFPELNIGDQIEVYGKLSGKYYRRLKISDISWIKIISRNNKSPPTKIIKAEEINFNNEGLLVEFIGKAVKLSGQIFYLEDETGKIKISIRKSANFKRQKMKKNDIIKIIGIVYCSKSGCSILPREKNDIEIIYTAKKYKKKKTNKKDKVIASLIGSSIDGDGKFKLADFLLSNILNSKSNLKNKIRLSQKSVLFIFYVMLITSVICIILLGELIWKRNLLLNRQGIPAS